MVEDVVGCKWTVQMLGAIADGHRRPGRLRRAVPGISAKVMNERLAKLIAFGVLERLALSDKPLHVEYHLTAKGRQLAELVGEIQAFCARWDRGTPDASRRTAAAPGSVSQPARSAAHARQEAIR
jgi:DNA-binding HxlR family transcriptional regulator